MLVDIIRDIADALCFVNCSRVLELYAIQLSCNLLKVDSTHYTHNHTHTLTVHYELLSIINTNVMIDYFYNMI
jgi:hypothetical protein